MCGRIIPCHQPNSSRNQHTVDHHPPDQIFPPAGPPHTPRVTITELLSSLRSNIPGKMCPFWVFCSGAHLVFMTSSPPTTAPLSSRGGSLENGGRSVEAEGSITLKPWSEELCHAEFVVIRELQAGKYDPPFHQANSQCLPRVPSSCSQVPQSRQRAN